MPHRRRGDTRFIHAALSNDRKPATSTTGSAVPTTNMMHVGCVHKGQGEKKRCLAFSILPIAHNYLKLLMLQMTHGSLDARRPEN
jgi:hypothetical protein